MEKKVNTRSYVDWLGSLLGMWWILAGASFIVSCIIGLTGVVLVTALGAVALTLLAKMGSGDKIKSFFNSALEHIKAWWSRKP